MVLLLASGVALLLFDQWSKKAVQWRPRNQAVPPPLGLRVRRVLNENRIYRSRNARIAMTLAWFIAFSSAMFLRRSGMWFRGEVSLIGLGLALGGAAGNLIDIWRHQSVVDFLDLGWWPVFNLADVGIVAGLFLAFWH